MDDWRDDDELDVDTMMCAAWHHRLLNPQCAVCAADSPEASEG